ncbi:MAG TPA: DddA-like double-stranded DNA deaminase toxin [Mycobacteriales bacterium]|nr:DddA-like double-stranded DNA deaminase toxin [Mycobacteriales bacterium]
MSTLEQVAARLVNLIDELPAETLRHVADQIDQLVALVAGIIDGTGNDLPTRAFAHFIAARHAAEATLDATRAVREHVQTYIAALGVTGIPQAGQTTPTVRSAHPPDPSRALAELPAWTRGDKTRGFWLDEHGARRPLVSGEHEPWFERANQRAAELGLIGEGATMATAADVELKFATRMRQDGIREATIVINRAPCGGRLGCRRNLPDFLPDGGALTIYAPDGFRHTYYGRGRSPR